MIRYGAPRLMAVPKTLEARIEIMRAVHKLMTDVAVDSSVRKFDPNQPRVPAGNPGGGQWTGEGASAGRGANSTTIVVAARRKQLEAECDGQYNMDIALCRIVRTPLCYERAMARYIACMGEQPLPPLQF